MRDRGTIGLTLAALAAMLIWLALAPVAPDVDDDGSSTRDGCVVYQAVNQRLCAGHVVWTIQGPDDQWVWTGDLDDTPPRPPGVPRYEP